MSYLDDFLDAPSTSAEPTKPGSYDWKTFFPSNVQIGRPGVKNDVFGLEKVAPEVLEAVRQGAKYWDGTVVIQDADRTKKKGEKGNHSGHWAADVLLVDKNGKPLTNIRGGGKTARTYEQFWQNGVALASELYPDLPQRARWGGNFYKSTPADYMHLDVTPGRNTHLGGNLITGATKQMLKRWGGTTAPMVGGSVETHRAWLRGQNMADREQIPGGLAQAMGPRVSNLRRDMRQYYGGSQIDAFLGNDSPTPTRYNPQEIQDYIRKRSVEAGLNPAMMLALAHRESGFDPTIKSKIKKNDYNKIGVGLYQFIPPTAKQWGLSDEERRDYRKSTDAAMRFMTHLKGRFNGDERLALAAWNAGEGSAKKGTGVRGALARGVDPDSITEGGHVAAVLNLMKKYESTPTPAPTAAPTRTASSDSFLSAFLDN